MRAETCHVKLNAIKIQKILVVLIPYLYKTEHNGDDSPKGYRSLYHHHHHHQRPLISSLLNVLAKYITQIPKFLARIDNSYAKFKHRSCLSSLQKFLTVCSKHILFDLSSRLASSDTVDSVLRHREIGRAKDLSAPL